MKKLIVSFLLAAVSMVSMHAQIAPGMKYREIKEYYYVRDYMPEANDPYSRGWAGVGSFLIPGLGQVIDGELGRGLVFFGASTAGYLLAVFNAARFADVCITDEDGYVTGYTDEAAAGRYSRNAVLSLLGMAVIDIWSIVDAIKVAKVKNMYYQDLRRQRSSVDFDFAPFLSSTVSSESPAAGLSMRVRF